MARSVTKSEGLVIEVNIDSDKFTINDAYEMRQARQKEAEASMSKWAKMDNDHRTVLEQIVKRAIESMHANTGQWLPHCLLDGEGGDRIDIRMTVLLSDIEAQVDLMVDATEFEVEATKRKLLEQIKGKRENVDEETFITYVDSCLSRGQRLSVDEAKRLREMLA